VGGVDTYRNWELEDVSAQNLFIFSPRLSLTRLLYPLFSLSAGPSTYEATSRSAREAHVAVSSRCSHRCAAAAARLRCSTVASPWAQLALLALLCYSAAARSLPSSLAHAPWPHITSLSSSRAASDVSAVRNRGDAAGCWFARLATSMPVEEELKLLLDGVWKKKEKTERQRWCLVCGEERVDRRKICQWRPAGYRRVCTKPRIPRKTISLLTTQKQSCAEPKKLATIPMDAVEPHFIS